MRTFIRSTTLAALFAMLLGLATVARAGVPGRPIDRPGGPPDPDPVMVGDPDAGNGGLVANWMRFVIAVELGNPRLRNFVPTTLRLMQVGLRPSASPRARR